MYMLRHLLPVLLFMRNLPGDAATFVYAQRNAAYYAIACIGTFWITYQLMGMKKHFDIPAYLEGREKSWLTSLYTAVLAQSNAMPDTTPKTNVARALFMLQVSLGWIWFLIFNA